jgi:hypothetical protein
MFVFEPGSCNAQIETLCDLANCAFDDISLGRSHFGRTFLPWAMDTIFSAKLTLFPKGNILFARRDRHIFVWISAEMCLNIFVDMCEQIGGGLIQTAHSIEVICG